MEQLCLDCKHVTKKLSIAIKGDPKSRLEAIRLRLQTDSPRRSILDKKNTFFCKKKTIFSSKKSIEKRGAFFAKKMTFFFEKKTRFFTFQSTVGKGWIGLKRPSGGRFWQKTVNPRGIL